MLVRPAASSRHLHAPGRKCLCAAVCACLCMFCVCARACAYVCLCVRAPKRRRRSVVEVVRKTLTVRQGLLLAAGIISDFAARTRMRRIRPLVKILKQHPRSDVWRLFILIPQLNAWILNALTRWRACLCSPTPNGGRFFTVVVASSSY